MSDSCPEKNRLEREKHFQAQLARYAPEKWRRTHPDSINDINPSFLAEFIDVSYHNDSMPFFRRYIGNNQHFVIAIDYVNKSHRDFPDLERFNAFIVVAAKEEFDGIEEGPFFGTGDFNEFQEFCNQYPEQK
ncbi:hypothetical protein [Paraglaciecola chathamensis]|uniref:Knr4/Smi1-like domain-containing protein n=1 Tax=Paraglaciecola agarilytica NO2 TaxID=1125747 RepID=A0ABQ0I208_9ALTE|nr:hypothetical protein [Paraglaciecola agarilytica]GAC03352.1 hypothetical protein GAGA_0487 [Paraglaciecola agarilytica NO2]